MSLVSQFFSDEDLDLMMIVETWQIQSVPGKFDAFSAAFKDHLLGERISANLFCAPRKNGRNGGGLALLTKKSLPISSVKLPISEPVSFEFLCCKIKADKHFLLLCVYRCPSNSFVDFLSEFSSLLLSLSSQSLDVVIAGDFNIKINLDNDPNTVSFNTLLFEHNMVILSPPSATHVLGNTLDFVVVPASLQPCISPISCDDTVTGSDHYPCLFSINSVRAVTNRPLRRSNLYRSFRSVNQEDFSHALRTKLSTLLISDISNFSEYLLEYRERVTDVLDTMAPLRQRQLTNTYARPPWLDSDYAKQRALRKRLQRRGDKSAYNAQKRYCQYLSKAKQISYNKGVIDDAVATNDQKQIYRAVNKLLDRSKENHILPDHTDSLHLANSLNNFFVDKPSTIRSTIPSISTEYPVDTPPAQSESYNGLSEFRPTSAEEISLIVQSHGVKVGPGDVLTPQIIKDHLSVLLPHFVKLVNLSLSTCSTEGLNEAHVVPIIKSLDLDPDNFKSYRPVSLLSFISKLTERIVHDRINEHLTANSLNSTSQFGYKKNHSVETLMLKLVDDILVAVDKKFGVVMLIVDLSAAFDTVDHSLRMKILNEKYQISGSALKWINSFLSDRSQRVKVGNQLSDSLSVLFGVPQGSILGPLLFNLYCSTINDAFNSSGFSSMGYADDNFGTRIFTARTKLSALSVSVPDCLSSVKAWTDAHFLKLNMEKTQIVAFGTRNFLSSLNISTIRTSDGKLIPVSKSTKILGIHLDNTLSLDTQVSHVSSSVNMVLRNLWSIRKYLDKCTAETMVHSLITNKLDQCNALYVGSSRSNFAKLQRLQNSALRLVLRLPQFSHVTAHMAELHWLSVEKRCYFKYLVTVFKCLLGIAPDSLLQKLKIKCPMNMLLDTSLFSPSSSIGRRAFSYLAPRCWNALPRDIRTIPYLNTFQAELKHYLFEHFNEFIRRCDPYTTERVSFSQP